jgi:hypothetical protein
LGRFISGRLLGPGFPASCRKLVFSGTENSKGARHGAEKSMACTCENCNNEADLIVDL